MAGTQALPARNHYVAEEVPKSFTQTREQGLEYMVGIEGVLPYIAFCVRQDAADMIAHALNAQVPVDVLEKPLTNWQLRDIAAEIAQLSNIDGPGNTVKGIVLLDMDEVMLGIEAINDLTGKRLAGGDGHKLEALEYKVVGHAADGNTLYVEITADASELLVPEDELTEECQNCQRRFKEDELINPIPDLAQRVLPGEPMPSGECPACGAICQPVEK
jgi:hypothetical protein